MSQKTITGLQAGYTPIIIGQPLTRAEKKKYAFKIFVFGYDASVSMKELYQELLEETNETLIPGLQEAASEIIEGMRIGGLAFGTPDLGSTGPNVWPLWDGKFFAINDVPKLTTKEYYPRVMTPLNEAKIAAIRAAKVESDNLFSETGTRPEVAIVMLTDGKNNCAPGYNEVLREAHTLDPEQTILALGAFDTEGYDGVVTDFDEIGRQTGFTNVFVMKGDPSETKAEKKKRFRKFMRIVSSSSVRSSKTKISQKSGFWVDPDDIEEDED